MQAASSRIAPVALELLNDYISLALAAPDGLASPSGMTQIMKLLKAGARRKISRARKKLLPSRRPTENV
jgi:hypothetical protein